MYSQNEIHGVGEAHEPSDEEIDEIAHRIRAIRRQNQLAIVAASAVLVLITGLLWAFATYALAPAFGYPFFLRPTYAFWLALAPGIAGGVVVYKRLWAEEDPGEVQ